MQQFQKIAELKKELHLLREKGKSVGFVPTMGALHNGHLALIRQAVAENDVCVCSIFVNPIQFNNKEDLEKYPRDLHADLEKLKSTGCHIVFAPESSEMYPEPDKTEFEFGQLDKVLEGKFRPGHFKGVAIVVKKLFEIVEPYRAYFGEKDFQQLAIIKRLVELKKLPVQIIPCPTVRETDGLAMSSRNLRLTNEERMLAPQIYQELQLIKSNFDGENAPLLIHKSIQNLNRLKGMKVEYLEIADTRTLLPFNSKMKNTEGAIALIATFLGNVRLIDNIRLN